MTRRPLLLLPIALGLLAPALLTPPALAARKPDPAPRIATIPIPGDKQLVAIARDIIEARVAMNPDLAASIGLYDDAIVVPSYTPEAVARQDARFAHDLDALAQLRASSWSRWSIDEQIDARWLQANAELGDRQLCVERLWTHRYGEYLEPVGNAFISLTAYAPDRVDLRLRLAALVPGMLAEMGAQVTRPTARDVSTAIGLLDGIQLAIDQLPEGVEQTSATAALAKSLDGLLALAAPGATPLPEFAVIGAENYTWRLQHALLLPWTPDQLVARAATDLARVDRELAALPAAVTVTQTEADRTAGAALDRDGFLALYGGLVAHNLEVLRGANVLTVPANFPPMHARETPAALVPLTGDGGSMNPPPAFGPLADGWWNVEHWKPEMSAADRASFVAGIRNADTSGLGTYAVHEGVPGHHLQLGMLRGMDPIHAILQDGSAVEGWALYAEQLFGEAGGFGPSEAARAAVLRSYRGRIRRVYYDVNIETGTWTLQQAEAWRSGTATGMPQPGTDVLRSINWPTQLITYYAGKSQILDLRDEVRKKQGTAYSERAFNDAVLAAGPIPIALIRAKVLGESPTGG